MIFYLTFNDTPSGIYSSQVIDVVKFLHTELQKDVRLVAFISLRNFKHDRKTIKSELSEAIILPMFPGVKRWRMNGILLYILYIFKKPTTIIGRSVFATQLALKLKEKKKNLKVIYDGRGAIEAEWKEYQVITDTKMVSEIFSLEKEAILKSDYRIAVSHQLVKHWQTHFSYHDAAHVVIPCTLNKVFESVSLTPEKIVKARVSLGIDQDDLVFVYSGSIAGWQSFDLLYHFIKPVLTSLANSKLLFLSDEDEHIRKLAKEFPTRILTKKVNPSQVPYYLMATDYGLLIREETVTNKVASPVKFAEYLACGLPVIISNHLGDYTSLSQKNNWGFLFSEFNSTKQRVSFIDKQIRSKQGVNFFSKKNYLTDYNALFKQ